MLNDIADCTIGSFLGICSSHLLVLAALGRGFESRPKDLQDQFQHLSRQVRNKCVGQVAQGRNIHSRDSSITSSCCGLQPLGHNALEDVPHKGRLCYLRKALYSSQGRLSAVANTRGILTSRFRIHLDEGGEHLWHHPVGESPKAGGVRLFQCLCERGGWILSHVAQVLESSPHIVSQQRIVLQHCNQLLCKLTTLCHERRLHVQRLVSKAWKQGPNLLQECDILLCQNL
mmetsp:Transcript_52135/g.93466  ORF Transcript_52135/g.93466 Transcript_52135/m.93466 type:complete len:230 (+) Transcript_52135:1806-2495(+)